MASVQTRPEISAVMPVCGRRDEVLALVEGYAAALREAGASFEIIVVLDGPKEDVLESLRSLMERHDWLRVIELARDFGESAALTAGCAEARGAKILTVPAYHQIEPAEIIKLIEAGREADMVIAVRWPRAGSALEGLRRKVFHGLLKFVSRQEYRDLGCGVRLMEREVTEEVPLYGERHRFYPALARGHGFRVVEVETAQSPEDEFRGRYRLREYLHRLLDLLTLLFLARFTKKPLRFFGTIGFLVSALGGVFLVVLVIQRLFFEIGLGDRPALLLSSLLVVLGVQIFALGLIGELIIFTHAREMKEYTIRRIIGAGEASESERRSA